MERVVEKTFNQITRWLTIVVCLVQAPFYLGTITQAFLPYEQFRSAYYIDPQSVAFLCSKCSDISGWFYLCNVARRKNYR